MIRGVNGRELTQTDGARKHRFGIFLKAVISYPAELKAAHLKIAELEKILEFRDREIVSIDQKHKTDNLTGRLNRNGLDAVIEDISADAHLPEHNYRKACILVLDLDKFKEINDLHGHIAGDQLLEQVFAKIDEIKVSSGMIHIARTGGDEGIGIFYDMRSKRAITKDHRKRDRRKRTNSQRNGDRKDRRSGKVRERVNMSFEDYAIGVVRKKLQEIADMEFEVDSMLGQKVKVQVGISDGYAIVTDLSNKGIRAGINEADVRASDRKRGLLDFKQAFETSKEVRQFFESIPGFDIDKPISLADSSAYDSKRQTVNWLIQNDPDIAGILPHLNERALQYVFPALKKQRSDIKPPIER